VSLEKSKTDEHGLAIHEECYVLKLRLQRASRESLPEPRHGLSLMYSNRNRKDSHLTALLRRFWTENEGQDIAEYAVMLAVILILVVGTIRLVGSNANNAFSSVASSLQ
jgi:Flp pilus assembly pilin Flp